MFKAAADGHLPNNDTIQEIGDHFGDDLQGEELRVELMMLKNSFQAMHFTMKNLKDQLLRYQHLFPELCKLFRLLLIMPASSATSERSFSSLRLVKSYLRTTMKQERLNHLLLLHIHKDRQIIDLLAAMREFVLLNDERLRIFGRF